MKDEIANKFEKVEKFKDDLHRKRDKLLKDEKELEAVKAKSAPEVLVG